MGGTVVSLNIKTAGFYKRYKVLAEGLDSWDLGLRSLEDLKKMIEDHEAK